MSPVTTSVETLEGNKVRLSVAVPEAEFDQAIATAFASSPGRSRSPASGPERRPGSWSRLGSVRRRAGSRPLRDAVPTYYADAVAAEDLDAIAPPEIDITAGEEQGDLAFDAVVEVRPVVELVGYEAYG